MASRIGAIFAPFVTNQLGAVAVMGPPLVFIGSCAIAMTVILCLGKPQSAPPLPLTLLDESEAHNATVADQLRPLESVNSCAPVVG